MKRKARSLDLQIKGDSAKMKATVDWAEKHKLEIYRPSPISYWIEGYMFWPNAGTIQVAGNDKKLKQYGLRGLAELLDKDPPFDLLVFSIEETKPER